MVDVEDEIKKSRGVLIKHWEAERPRPRGDRDWDEIGAVLARRPAVSYLSICRWPGVGSAPLFLLFRPAVDAERLWLRSIVKHGLRSPAQSVRITTLHNIRVAAHGFPTIEADSPGPYF